MRAGLPRRAVDGLPALLGLSGFEVVWDEAGVGDGALRVDEGHGGTPDQLAALLGGRLRGPAGELAAAAARARFGRRPDAPVTGEAWCDTAFDLAATALGLSELGLTGLAVHGPLPTTPADHPLARILLAGWSFTPLPTPVELVTPTAAALLSVCGVQLPAADAPAAEPLAPIRGRFVRRHGLAPVLVWPVDRPGG